MIEKITFTFRCDQSSCRKEGEAWSRQGTADQPMSDGYERITNLPLGWGMIVIGYPQLFCDKCLKSWAMTKSQEESK